MAGIFSFKCSCCGKIHEGSPSFSYPEPLYVASLSEEERKRDIEKSNDDLFVVKYEGGCHHFVRVVLEIPIHGCDEPFTWGVWVSLSEQSFNRYVETWDDVDESDSYFGWFNNELPYYDQSVSIKTQVRPRKGGIRPYLELEEGSCELADDLYNGISVEKAQKIAEICMHKS